MHKSLDLLHCEKIWLWKCAEKNQRERDREGSSILEWNAALDAKVFTVGQYLEVSTLGLEPVLNEVLRVVAEAQHEVSLGLQLVNRLNGLVDLRRVE